ARAGVLGIAGSPSNALKAAVVSGRERINDVGIAMSPIFRADAIFAEPSSDHSTRPERLPATTRKISAITHERIDRCQTPVKVGAFPFDDRRQNSDRLRIAKVCSRRIRRATQARAGAAR